MNSSTNTCLNLASLPYVYPSLPSFPFLLLSPFSFLLPSPLPLPTLLLILHFTVFSLLTLDHAYRLLVLSPYAPFPLSLPFIRARCFWDTRTFPFSLLSPSPFPSPSLSPSLKHKKQEKNTRIMQGGRYQ